MGIDESMDPLVVYGGGGRERKREFCVGEGGSGEVEGGMGVEVASLVSCSPSLQNQFIGRRQVLFHP